MKIISTGSVDVYSNASGKKINLTDEQKDRLLQASQGVLSTTIGAIQNRQTNPRVSANKDLKSTCGRKPLFGKDKKAAYQKCVDGYMKTGTSQGGSYTEPSQSYAPTATKSNKGLYIGLAVTGVVALGIIALVIYNKKKK